MTDRREQTTHVCVPTECAGLRLDVVLSELFHLSRASLQRYVEEGRVFVNGTVQKKRYRVEAGDQLVFCMPLNDVPHVAPEKMSFDVLYEDSFLFVINKPSGLVVHPAPGNTHGTFINGFVDHCRDLECSDPIRPGLVHRLDKDTSGVLIAAKTNSVLEALSQQFHDRTVAKEYLAIVVGTMEEEKQIASPIGRSRHHRQRMAVVPEGRESYTVARPMKVDQLEEMRDGRCPEGYTLVHVLPRTGRTHQVRVHLASVGYPILGDAVYGNRDTNLRWEGLRQMLHCWKLIVTHPVTGERLSIRAPLPEDMRQVLTLRSSVPEAFSQ